MAENEAFDEIFQDEASSFVQEEAEEDLLSEFDESLEDDNAKRGVMETGVVELGKQPYAVGLSWFSVDEAGKVGAEAKATATLPEYEADFFCTRNGEAEQFALGWQEKGHKAGIPSLAASLADYFEDNWLGVFEVVDGYYLVAQREGLVLSNCDLLFFDEEEAKKEFASLMTSAYWDKLYAPDDWGLENSEEIDISSIDLPKVGKLKNARAFRKFLRVALPLAILGAGGYFGYTYYDENIRVPESNAPITEPRVVQTPPPIEKIITAVEDKVAPILGIEEPPAPVDDTPPPPPWLGSREALGSLRVCVDDIKKAPTGLPGWELTSASCVSGRLNYSFQKVGGTIPWAEYYLRENGFPDIDLSSSAGSSMISVSTKGTFVSDYPANMRTRKLEEVERHLKFSMEEYGIAFEWRVRAVNPQNKVDRFYRIADFSFSTDFGPMDFMRMLEPVSVLDIEAVNYSVEAGTWGIRGTVYEKRDHPLPPPPPPPEN